MCKEKLTFVLWINNFEHEYNLNHDLICILSTSSGLFYVETESLFRNRRKLNDLLLELVNFHRSLKTILLEDKQRSKCGGVTRSYFYERFTNF